MRQLDYWFSNVGIVLTPEMKKAPMRGFCDQPKLTLRDRFTKKSSSSETIVAFSISKYKDFLSRMSSKHTECLPYLNVSWYTIFTP